MQSRWCGVWRSSRTRFGFLRRWARRRRIRKVQQFSALTKHIRAELSKVIVGQQEVIDQFLLVIVCGGHAVVEGVPGLAKTLMVKSLARVCGLGFQRVQCTADVMPADITGTNVFDMSSSSFNLHRGPIFTD